MSLALRPFLPSDASRLAAIFRDAIDVLAEEEYSDDQRAAWASAADDVVAFAERLSGELTIIAHVDGEPVGFASLAGKDHFDLLYVDPRVARQGVATMLCDAIEKLAGARGATLLIVDASDTARRLFEKRGYIAWRRNTVEIEGEWLATTTMRKDLAHNDNAQGGGPSAARH